LKDLSRPLGFGLSSTLRLDRTRRRQQRFLSTTTDRGRHRRCRPVGHDKRQSFPRRDLQRLLALDGDLVPHLLPYARRLALVPRGHVHPVFAVHAHRQLSTEDFTSSLGLFAVAQRHVFQVGRDTLPWQASQVCEEDLFVCGPRQPAHGLKRDSRVFGDVLSEAHQRCVVASCGLWEQDPDGRDEGCGHEGDQYERYARGDDHGGHPPHGGVGIEVHAWSDHPDSEAEHDYCNAAGHANEDSEGLAGLVDIEEVKGGDHCVMISLDPTMQGVSGNIHLFRRALVAAETAPCVDA
jgi:hypothetical protein